MRFLNAIIKINVMINEMLFEIAMISERFSVTRLYNKFAQNVYKLKSSFKNKLTRRHCASDEMSCYELEILKKTD